MTVDADSREVAVEKMKGMMSADVVAAHFTQKHPGEIVPSRDEIAANIESGLQQLPITTEFS